MGDKFIDKVTILYVEDEEEIREGLSKTLKRRAKEVFVAKDGAQGYEFFLQYKPDIVISDIQMPILNGLDMAKKIKTTDSSTPIIITTAFSDEHYLLKSIEIGVDRYVKKPLDRIKLFDAIGKLAKNIILEKEIRAKSILIDSVLDMSPNYIFILENKQITYINQAFLEFLEVDSIKGLQSDRYCMIDYMILSEEYSSFDAFCHWVISSKNSEVLIDMYSKNKYSDKKLMVRAKQITNTDSYIFYFTDVTRIENERRKYYKLSNTDPLTKIYNRSKFFDELEREIDRLRRYKNSFSVLMADIDFFKKVNDVYGHQTGDSVLVSVVEEFKKNIRKPDIMSRYGGEEFIILLPSTNLDNAKGVAEKLRIAVMEHQFKDAGHITCSFGVIEAKSSEDKDSILKRVDSALYEAKNSGRNKVVAND